MKHIVIEDVLYDCALSKAAVKPTARRGQQPGAESFRPGQHGGQMHGGSPQYANNFQFNQYNLNPNQSPLHLQNRFPSSQYQHQPQYTGMDRTQAYRMPQSQQPNFSALSQMQQQQQQQQLQQLHMQQQSPRNPYGQMEGPPLLSAPSYRQSYSMPYSMDFGLSPNGLVGGMVNNSPSGGMGYPNASSSRPMAYGNSGSDNDSPGLRLMDNRGSDSLSGQGQMYYRVDRNNPPPSFMVPGNDMFLNSGVPPMQGPHFGDPQAVPGMPPTLSAQGESRSPSQPLRLNTGGGSGLLPNMAPIVIPPPQISFYPSAQNPYMPLVMPQSIPPSPSPTAASGLPVHLLPSHLMMSGSPAESPRNWQQQQQQSQQYGGASNNSPAMSPLYPPTKKSSPRNHDLSRRPGSGRNSNNNIRPPTAPSNSTPTHQNSVMTTGNIASGGEQPPSEAETVETSQPSMETLPNDGLISGNTSHQTVSSACPSVAFDSKSTSGEGMSVHMQSNSLSDASQGHL